MSDADRVRLAYAEEDSYGVLSATTGQELRFTSESLRQDTTVVTSKEIRDDRQITDVIRTSIRAMGDLGFELSYGTLDDFFQAALFASAWSSVVDVAAESTSVGNGDGIYTAAAGTPFSSMAANQWVKITGASNAANNGYFKITAVGGSGASITTTNSSSVTEGPVALTYKMGPQIVNGTTFNHYTLERGYSDIASTYALFSGMTVDTLSLEIPSDNIITGSLGFAGKDEDSTTSTVFSTAITDANTNEVMNSIDNVAEALENAASISITQLNFALANGLRGKPQIANLGPVGYGAGKCNVTGVLQQYFATATLMDKYLDQTESSLSVRVTDDAGNAYILDWPRIKYGTGQRVAGGEETDIIADLTWRAYRHATEGITMRIARFAAA